MTDKPVRIQRKRTKGWKMPTNTVYVGRPTKWGNPYRVGMWLNYEAAEAVRDFRNWATGDYTCNGTAWGNGHGKEMATAAAIELRGKDLACWCPLDQPCHADVLLEIANAGPTK